MLYRRLSLMFLASSLAGCMSSRTTSDVGEWLPMTDDYEEIDFSKEYGMLAANHIFDGLGYWEDSPIYLKPPYSFHWYGDKIRVWSPYKTKSNTFSVSKFEIDIEKCDGLGSALNLLKNEVKLSASKMVDDGPEMDRTTIVMSPTFYQIKIFPPNMLGSITLNSIEWDRVSWIKEAQNVKTIVESCTKS